MRLSGFQKMTMLDYPGKVACTLFTAGCNLRCPFCHNSFLVTRIDASDYFEEEEIFSYLEKRKGLLDGVAVTGGEPLMQPGIFDLMRKIKGMGLAVKLDTNGTFPERLERVIAEKLADYVAMDVKNCPDQYAATVGVPDFDVAPIEKSIDILKSSGIPFEFRTTVVAQFHNVENIAKLAKWIAPVGRYYLQNFVDSGNLIGEGMTGVEKSVMLEMQKEAAKYIPNTQIRGI